MNGHALVANCAFFRPGIENRLLDIHSLHRPGLKTRVAGPDIAELLLVDQAHFEQRPGSGAVVVFSKNVLEVVAKDIAFVDQQILDRAREFAQLRSSRKNVLRLGPGERLLQQPVLRIDKGRPKGRPHVDEIRDRIARNRKHALLPAIDIGDMVNFLPEPVAKQGGVHEDELPQQAATLEKRGHVERVRQRCLADPEIHEHVAHGAVAGRVDRVDERRAAVAHERVLRGEATFPSRVFPALEGRSHNPTRFLSHRLDKAPGEILAHRHTLGDFFLRNDASLGIAL